jgi:hypothetical protein
MKKYIPLTLLMFAFIFYFGQSKVIPQPGPLVCVGEEDGDPSVDVLCVYGIKFANGNVTENADGTASVADQTGAGSGDITDVGDCATGAAFTGACGTQLDSNTDIILNIDADNNGTESVQILDGADAKVAEILESGQLFTLVGLDGIGAVDLDYGSPDITDHTFVSDSTGDGEVVLPNDSIGPNEIDSTTGAYDFGGVTSFEIPNSTSDLTLSADGQIGIQDTDDQFCADWGGAGEISVEACISGLRHVAVTVDPGAWYDSDAELFLFTVKDDAPEGIIIVEWTSSCNVDPDVEIDADLRYADAWIGLANAADIDEIDTTNGTSSEDTNANINGGSAVANGKVVYIGFDADPEGTCVQWTFEMWLYNEED